jgi:tetratricopeptide (TPR) repeat protein
MRRCYWFALLVWSGGLLTGCRIAPLDGPVRDGETPASASRDDSAQEQEIQARADAHAHYATGIIHDLNNESDLALAEFERAALGDPDDEQLVLEVSRRLLQAKQPEKALEVLKQAAARPGASGAIFARLGLVYGRLGRNDEAVAANRMAIKKSPRQLTGYRNLFFHALENKKPDEALKLLADAARQNGVGAEFLVGLADLYDHFALQFPSQREAVRAKSLAVLNRAAALKPADPQTRLRLADGFYELGSTNQAAELYLGLLDELADLPLVRTTVRAKLADLFYRNRDRPRAIEQLQAIVRDDPSNALAYYFLGRLALEDQRWTDAADFFQKALLFNSKLELAYYDLARAQLTARRPADAVNTLQAAGKLFPQSYTVEFWLGFAQERLKNPDEARRRFTAAEIMAKAQTTNDPSPEFYFQFGAVCERSGDAAEAAKYFEKCLELRPDFPEAQNYLGYMWAERGENLDRARVLIEQAVQAEPNNAAFLDSLGWVLFKQNQPRAALDYLLKAVAAAETPDATLFEHLGDVYAALQQMDKAREAWRQSLAVEPNEAVQKKLDAANRLAPRPPPR